MLRVLPDAGNNIVELDTCTVIANVGTNSNADACSDRVFHTRSLAADAGSD